MGDQIPTRRDGTKLIHALRIMAAAVESKILRGTSRTEMPRPHSTSNRDSTQLCKVGAFSHYMQCFKVARDAILYSMLILNPHVEIHIKPFHLSTEAYLVKPVFVFLVLHEETMLTRQ